MTVYSDILSNEFKAEPTQAGRTVLSMSFSTVLTIPSAGRINSIFDITATNPSLILSLPSGTELEEGFDAVFSNVGAIQFTIETTPILVGRTYWSYIDTTGTWKFYRQGGLIPAEVNSLAGFAISSSGTQLSIDTTALAGLGLSSASSSSPLDINVDNSTLEISADFIRVKALGITGAHFANLTITAGKFASPLVNLDVVQATNAALASGATLTVLTPGRTQANQFNVLAQVVELVGGTERRIAKETDYRIDLSREDQITATKLTAGPTDVIFAVAYEVG